MSASRDHARLLMQRQRFVQAEQTWRLVLSEQPDDAEGHASLALCLCERASYDEAQSEAGLAIRIAPDQAFVHYVHARILRERNRYEGATQAINEAIRLAPGDADYRAVLASILGAQAHWRACLDAADAGLALDATHLGCANLRAMALTSLNRTDEAAATIAGALQQSPENSLTHANQGWALLHSGQASAALGHFRESLRLGPNNDWAREGLLTALKAHNSLFRMMLSFLLFMRRQGSAARWTIIIGIFAGQNIMGMVAHNYPQYSVLLWPVIIALFTFVYMTWLANPLMNLVMRLHPMGRHALNADQRSQSTLVGLTLGATVLNLGIQCVNGGINYSSMILPLLALPLSTIHIMERGWPRVVATCVGIVFAGVAIEATVTYQLIQPYIRHQSQEPDALLALLASITFPAIRPYFISIMAWSFIAPFLSRVQPVR